MGSVAAATGVGRSSDSGLSVIWWSAGLKTGGYTCRFRAAASGCLHLVGANRTDFGHRGKGNHKLAAAIRSCADGVNPPAVLLHDRARHREANSEARSFSTRTREQLEDVRQ